MKFNSASVDLGHGLWLNIRSERTRELESLEGRGYESEGLRWSLSVDGVGGELPQVGSIAEGIEIALGKAIGQIEAVRGVLQEELNKAVERGDDLLPFGD